MGKSDTFRKATEKGGVVVIKSRTDSPVSPNHSELIQRNLPETGENLVRITHIMLKKQFYLTTEYISGILAMLIRIEVYRASSERNNTEIRRDAQRTRRGTVSKGSMGG